MCMLVYVGVRVCRVCVSMFVCVSVHGGVGGEGGRRGCTCSLWSNRSEQTRPILMARCVCVCVCVYMSKWVWPKHGAKRVFISSPIAPLPSLTQCCLLVAPDKKEHVDDTRAALGHIY